MSPQTLPPVAVAIGFVDCINRGDVDGLGRLMTDDHVLRVFDEAPVEGRAANIAGWRGYIDSFPEYVVHPRRIVDNDGTVGILGYTTGSHLGLSDDDESLLTLIWIADVVAGAVRAWTLVEDSAENRGELGLEGDA